MNSPRAPGLVLVALVVATEAHAICGHDPRDVSEVFAESDAVFLGYVFGVSGPKSPPGSGDDTSSSDSLVELRVIRSWKGITEPFVTVAISNLFDFGFDAAFEKRYLIWATRDREGRLTVIPCGRTSPSETESFRTDITWLDAHGAGGSLETDPRFETYRRAQVALEGRRYAEAVPLLESLLGENEFRYRREAQADLGLAYQKLQRFQDAVKTFTHELREPFGTETAWDEQSAANRRAAAQWGLAVSLVGSGQYQRALQAIDDSASRYPPSSWCGNAGWEADYRNALYRGLTLERLGRYPEAIDSYVDAALGNFQDPTAALRLADLYESAGRLGELVALAANAPEENGAILRRLVQLREMERSLDYRSLVRILPVRQRSGGMPWEDFVRRSEWEAAEAAALLARHPAATVPLLARELQNLGDHGFVYYALGLCATKEASELLKAELLDANKTGYTMTLVYVLTLAGAPGRHALDELSPDHPAVAGYRSHQFPRHWFLEEGIEFPKIPNRIQLPALRINPRRDRGA